MKIVGTANFQPLWGPLSCRLIRYTTTLSEAETNKLSSKRYQKFHQIMKTLAPNQPVMRTYVTVWCVLLRAFCIKGPQ